nr:MarR family transcriptional regulator [Planosporangium flavigriseum]
MERVVSLVRRLIPAQGFSPTAVSTLRTLERSGPYRLSDLAAVEGVTQPAMTQMVSHLERDGYLERRKSPDDARVVLVHLTPAGRNLVRQRRDDRAQSLAKLTGHLSADERAALAAALPALDRLTALHPNDAEITCG